jgi:hypothetical protein
MSWFGIQLFVVANDIIDFVKNTHEGKNPLYATAIVACQQKQKGVCSTSTLPSTTKASSFRGFKRIIPQNSGNCGTQKPTQSPKYPGYYDSERNE